MIDKAIKKITEEMMKIDSPLAQGIEEHLTGLCKSNDVAEKLLDETKSLKTLCDNITAEARSRQKNGVAYIQPEEVLQMADDYYGIGSAPKKDHIDVMDLL